MELMESIPFNRPYTVGNEITYIRQAEQMGMLAGDGHFSRLCHGWLEKELKTSKALLTHSCTAALEISALLLDLVPGDEIIMPSYTFVSTANAFVLRGAKPVFVDIRPDTLNINEQLIEEAITSRTKAILPVHYAGVACEMDIIMAIAKKYHLKVIEDAAQGIMSDYKGQALGTIGDLGTLSFHETKNIISGEGGALLVNNPCFSERAEILREKGTDRNRFFRGEVDKYTWQDLGSSYLCGELVAAYLWGQLQSATDITLMRKQAWLYYHELLHQYELSEQLRRPIIPEDCSHNAHIYYVLLASTIDRQQVLRLMKSAGVNAVFHYVPLHSSPAGQRFCRSATVMTQTDKLSRSIIRLPLWPGIKKIEQEHVVKALAQALVPSMKKEITNY